MIDKIFYVLLSYYSRNTNHKKDTPVITVFFIFILLFFCMLLAVYHLFRTAFLDNLGLIPTKQFVTWSLTILATIIDYVLFVYKKRHVEIYKRYRSDSFLNSKFGRWSYWVLFFVLMASPFILTAITNKFVKGF